MMWNQEKHQNTNRLTFDLREVYSIYLIFRQDSSIGASSWYYSTGIVHNSAHLSLLVRTGTTLCKNIQQTVMPVFKTPPSVA